jgi:iron-sulfur cluster insertion protein
VQITITDSAASRICTLIQSEPNPEKLRLRVRVSGGGCSGFQYGFVIDETLNSDDLVFEKNGVFVVIDETSLNLLEGSQVDYVEDLTTASFVIKNPNAASSCGCGNSFSI